MRLAVVTAVTCSRFLAAATLILCGEEGWWWSAALLLASGFLTDMVDGALARFWHAQSDRGKWLDSLADAALTAGALAAAIAGGIWPWWSFAVLAVAYAITRSIESRVRGRWLQVLVIGHPVANLSLIAGLETSFLHAADGEWYAAIVAVCGTAVLMAVVKRTRIRQYIQNARRR